MKRMLALVTGAALLIGAPNVAHAWNWWDPSSWFQSSPQGASHAASVRVLYTVSQSDDSTCAGTFPAYGVRVAVFTSKSLFGSPNFQDAQETGADGRVTLHYVVNSGEKVTFRVTTDGSHAKTFPGAWNLFASPHSSDFQLSAGESAGDVSRDLSFGGTFDNALAVQSAGTHARTYGEGLLASVVPGCGYKVSYSYPGFIQFGTTYTPFKNRVVVTDDPYMRSTGTIFHETGHTFWYAARGHVEYYWPLKHDMTAKAGNTHLAMSEGLADFFAVCVRDRFGAIQNRPDIANHEYYWAGFYHVGRNHPEIPFASWQDDNETNVACALYDLVADGNVTPLEQGTVAASRFGSVDRGIQAVFGAVVARSQRGGGQIALADLWSGDLRGTFGAAAANALSLNGVPAN